jgi:ppGpp synthetase/RelA/SpoT-type nucleotidyltranferase
MIDEEKIREEYQKYIEDFESIKEDIVKTLKKIINKYHEEMRFEAVYVHKARLKDVTRLIEKLKRKGREGISLFKKNDKDEIELVVNDFIGARISCNTKDDVKRIVELIGLSDRFSNSKPEEKFKPSGYRAWHVDLFYKTYLDDSHVLVPLELQIKTHLQTAWGDITHDESYVPQGGIQKNVWEAEYSKHMADMLDTLDEMARTIRQQRLTTVSPPEHLRDDDINVNQNTISYLISEFGKNETVTRQKMDILLQRLSEQKIETLAQAKEILNSQELEKKVKTSKEKLKNYENVSAFELLYYGTLLNTGKIFDYETEINKDYGYSVSSCLECKRFLTENEYKFMKEKTDTDIDFYCEEHRNVHFPNTCKICQKLKTSQEICKNCEAEESPY